MSLVALSGETLTRVLKLCIALFAVVSQATRFALRRHSGYPAASNFVVLMYHSVKRHERERFARQMDHLVRVARPVYADFAGAQTADGSSYVAVTFDDAYQSVLENAVPILQERSIPATFFVPTKYLGSRPGWITNERHRNAGERLLTMDELRYVQKSGGLIGSHGVSHRSLTELSRAEAFAELTESRQVLQGILGQKVGVFALPYGSSNPDVLRMAAHAGYERIFLSVPLRSSGNIEEQVVGRIDVSPTDWPLEYRLKVRGAYRWLPLAIAAKGRIVAVLRQLF